MLGFMISATPKRRRCSPTASARPQLLLGSATHRRRSPCRSTPTVTSTRSAKRRLPAVSRADGGGFGDTELLEERPLRNEHPARSHPHHRQVAALDPSCRRSVRRSRHQAPVSPHSSPEGVPRDSRDASREHSRNHSRRAIVGGVVERSSKGCGTCRPTLRACAPRVPPATVVQTRGGHVPHGLVSRKSSRRNRVGRRRRGFSFAAPSISESKSDLVHASARCWIMTTTLRSARDRVRGVRRPLPRLLPSGSACGTCKCVYPISCIGQALMVVLGSRSFSGVGAFRLWRFGELLGARALACVLRSVGSLIV
jgi:hypothetical protein